jgi:diaminopropionate ammonia-lyase
VVVDGNYDDVVRQVDQDARSNSWEVVSDTSWEGYEDIPRWVMQGYTTMLSEAQEQLAAQGLSRPTLVFVQAGVGSLERVSEPEPQPEKWPKPSTPIL